MRIAATRFGNRGTHGREFEGLSVLEKGRELKGLSVRNKGEKSVRKKPQRFANSQAVMALRKSVALRSWLFFFGTQGRSASRRFGRSASL